MPFPPAVRNQILVASANHCCVCHRYCGVLIEVHHIIQEADGGPNTFENAIALCFDCHAWAGHYNPNHPKGTKYSPDQLRLAKKEWLALVAKGSVGSAGREVWDVRFLLCRDADVSRDLLKGDLTLAPVSNPLLLENAPAAFARKALRDGASSRFLGGTFDTIEEYQARYPNARIKKSIIQDFPYYDTVRKCEPGELEAQVAPKDAVVRLALESGANSDEMSVVVSNNNQCGDGGLGEVYLTRPPWVLFLVIANVTDQPHVIEGALGLHDKNEGVRPFPTAGDETTIDFPRCSVPAGASILVPIALMLGPLSEAVDAESTFVKRLVDRGEYSEDLSYSTFLAERVSELRVLGPVVIPTRLLSAQGEVVQAIRKVEFVNLYTIDRAWQCGSCPHLFVGENGTLQHVTELIPAGAGRPVVQTVALATASEYLVLAELEDEVTRFSTIALDGQEIRHDITLRKGEWLRIPLLGRTQLRVEGAYYPLRPGTPEASAGVRNRLIFDFIRQWGTAGDAQQKEAHPTDPVRASGRTHLF